MDNFWKGAMTPHGNRKLRGKGTAKEPFEGNVLNLELPDLLDTEVVINLPSSAQVVHFTENNVHYVAVQFNHSQHGDADVPSNDKVYVYAYDENDLEEALDSEFEVVLD